MAMVERDVRRYNPLGWPVFLAAFVSLAAIGALVWWLS
jgi:hypothetical protein